MFFSSATFKFRADARKEATGAQLVDLSAARFAATAPFMRFLCEAAGVHY